MIRAAIFLALLGCTDKSTSEPIEDSVPPVVTVETGTVTDTGDTDTGAIDTGETDSLSAVALYPDDLVVHPGATFSLRALGTWTDGSVAALSPDFASSDEAVATVDADGLVTAVGPGSAELTATADSQSGSVSVTVSDAGLMQVSVISATNGAALASVKVKVGAGALYQTGKDGTVSIPVSSAGPLEVTAYGGDVMPATIWGTVSRDVVLPVHTKDEFWADNARIEGDVDFSGVDGGGVGDISLGLVVPSFRYGPLMVEPDDLVAEDRTLTIFGQDVALPANLALDNIAPTYVAGSPAGSGAVWALAGAVPIGDVTDTLSAEGNSTENALALLEDNIDALAWTWRSAGGLSSGETSTVDLQPSISFTGSVSVETGPLPGGFAGTEKPLVLVGESLPGAGVVVTGIALGAESVAVPTVPEGSVSGSDGAVAMAMAQVSGLGSGGAISSAWGPVVDGAAVLPLFQNMPSVSSFDAESHAFEMWTDPRSTYVRLLLQSRDGTARLVYLDGGQAAGVLADPGFPMGYAVVIWRILSLETTTDTFEGMVRRGALRSQVLAPQSWTSSQANVTISVQ